MLETQNNIKTEKLVNANCNLFFNALNKNRSIVGKVKF